MKHDSTYISKKTQQTVVIPGVPVVRYLKESNEPLYSLETAERVQEIIKAALKSTLPYVETKFELALNWDARVSSKSRVPQKAA